LNPGLPRDRRKY